MRAKKMLLSVLMAATLFAMVGCGSDGGDDPTTPTTSRFLGRWQMTLISNPSDPAMDVRFNADGTLFIYDRGSQTVKLSGSYTSSGDTATGTWKHNSLPNQVWGSFNATLMSDTRMNFTFIEEQYTPPKAFDYDGNKTTE
jgi:hypothetical protein